MYKNFIRGKVCDRKWHGNQGKPEKMPGSDASLTPREGLKESTLGRSNLDCQDLRGSSNQSQPSEESGTSQNPICHTQLLAG